jgi:hypothetical protein
MAAGDLTPIQGKVDQGIFTPYGGLQQPRFSPLRSLYVDQVMPSRMELVRMGKTFSASGGVVANAIQSVVDMPTTATTNGLYNNNSQVSNVCLVLLKVSCYAASGTLGLGHAIVAGTGSSPQSSVPAKGTGVVGPNNNLPSSTNTSNAIMTTGVALGGAPAWDALGGTDNPAAVEIGAGVVADVEGLYIVPPGYMFGTHVLSPTGTTPKYLFTFVWAEYVVIPQ